MERIEGEWKEQKGNGKNRRGIERTEGEWKE